MSTRRISDEQIRLTDIPNNATLAASGDTIVGIRNNLSASEAPDGDDNFSAGYSVGSLWQWGARVWRCYGDGEWQELATGGGGGVPVGTVVPFAGTSAPAGWLFLYGQAISRTTYANLFAALGTTYGNGDGSTTFNLPDLRGRVVAGKDDMGGTSANRLTSPINGDNLGANGGSESHTLTTEQMPSHNHVIGSHSHTIGSHSHTVNSHIHSLPTYTSLQWLQNGTGHTLNNIWAGIGSSSTGSSSPGTSSVSPSCSSVSPSCGSRGSSQAHPNVQPTIILQYMIFAGVYAPAEPGSQPDLPGGY